MEAGYSIKDCAQVFKVTVQTVKKWDKGKRKPPEAVLICLQLFSGRLDHLGKHWRGFRILPDCIEADNGNFIWHYEINALPYLYNALEIQRYKFLNAIKQTEEAKEHEQKPQGFKPHIVK